jgi:hypothetical protein
MSSMHGKFAYSCARGIRMRILGSVYWRTAGSVSHRVCAGGRNVLIYIYIYVDIYVCILGVSAHACLHTCNHRSTVHQHLVSAEALVRGNNTRFSIVNKKLFPAGGPCLEKAAQELVTPNPTVPEHWQA